MLNVFPSNNSHQEQTHYFTRDVQTYHHDCPFCNQQFHFTQSRFNQNGASLSQSGFHQGPPLLTNTAICDNPTCVVCSNGSPRMIDAEEVYEYQRNLPPPCAICGDHSFVQGMAPYNTLTLRKSQFVRTEPSFVTRSLGPISQQQMKNYREKVVDYGNQPVTSKSTIFRQENDPKDRIVSIGDRMIIKTPKDEYKDVRKSIEIK